MLNIYNLCSHFGSLNLITKSDRMKGGCVCIRHALHARLVDCDTDLPAIEANTSEVPLEYRYVDVYEKMCDNFLVTSVTEHFTACVCPAHRLIAHVCLYGMCSFLCQREGLS